jgi:hypothetical protein
LKEAYLSYGVSDTLIRRIRRGEIWTDERPREAGRLPVVATLLAGPRILELSKLDRSDIDLAARQIRMPRVKTAPRSEACRCCRRCTRSC